MLRLARLLLSAALLLIGGAAAAQSTLKIKYLGKEGDAPTVSNSEISNYQTGHLNYIDDTGSSFLAYCIEPKQPNAPTDLGFRTYTTGSFTGMQATLLQGLYSSSFAGLTSAHDEAAFQLAVWEIMRESSGILGLGTGSFKITGGDTSGTLLIDGNSFLAAAQSYVGPSLYTLTRMSNNVYQDLVVAQIAPVPEPSRLALMAAGLAAVGFVAARRRRTG